MFLIAVMVAPFTFTQIYSFYDIAKQQREESFPICENLMSNFCLSRYQVINLPKAIQNASSFQLLGAETILSAKG